MNIVLRATNADGLAMLRQGKLGEAKSSFERAMSDLLSAGAAVDDSKPFEITPIAVVDLQMDSIPPEFAISPENSFEMYTKCFEILQTNGFSPSQQATVTAALMFNMALAFHMEFTRTGAMRSLRAAGSLYRKALQTVAAVMEDEAELMVCVLWLAILNNLGHCLAHLFNSNSVNMCRRQIRELVLRNWDVAKEDSSLQQEFSFFYSNLLFRPIDDVNMTHSAAA